MKMSQGDLTTFPQFASYVKIEMPKLNQNALIVSALKKFGNMTPAQVISCLNWDQGPLIKLVDFGKISCKTGDMGTGVYGCNRNSTEIEIEKKYVQDFERSILKSTDNGNTRGHLVYVVGATLLHESCHWGNKLNSVAEAVEMGLAFETQVYGKTIW